MSPNEIATAAVDEMLAQYGDVPAVMTALDRRCRLKAGDDRRRGLIRHVRVRGGVTGFHDLVDSVRTDCMATEGVAREKNKIGHITAKAQADEILEMLTTPETAHYLNHFCLTPQIIKSYEAANDVADLRDRIAARIRLPRGGHGLLQRAETLVRLGRKVWLGRDDPSTPVWVWEKSEELQALHPDVRAAALAAQNWR